MRQSHPRKLRPTAISSTIGNVYAHEESLKHPHNARLQPGRTIRSSPIHERDRAAVATPFCLLKSLSGGHHAEIIVDRLRTRNRCSTTETVVVKVPDRLLIATLLTYAAARADHLVTKAVSSVIHET